MEAATGTQALRLIERQPPDILLVDVGLPDMSGVTLADRARSILPTLGVVFATGHGVVEGIVQGPLVKLLRKPFQFARLEAVVGEIGTAIREGHPS